MTAETEDGIVMAFEHRTEPVSAVQFHPESVATEHGQALGANIVAWLLHDRARDGAIDRRC